MAAALGCRCGRASKRPEGLVGVVLALMDINEQLRLASCSEGTKEESAETAKTATTNLSTASLCLQGGDLSRRRGLGGWGEILRHFSSIWREDWQDLTRLRRRIRSLFRCSVVGREHALNGSTVQRSACLRWPMRSASNATAATTPRQRSPFAKKYSALQRPAFSFFQAVGWRWHILP